MMSEEAEKSDPKLWDKVKTKVLESKKGGKPGQWSARKAQLAVHDYKEEGGGYKGPKSADNHLAQWTAEDWGTKSGRKSGDTGERYLPREARDALSTEDYARTTKKKRADTRKGKQFSAQPRDVAAKTAPYRHPDMAVENMTRAELYRLAQAKQIAGRSHMRNDELAKALSQA